VYEGAMTNANREESAACTASAAAHAAVHWCCTTEPLLSRILCISGYARLACLLAVESSLVSSRTTLLTSRGGK